jgi:hypothetical protein
MTQEVKPTYEELVELVADLTATLQKANDQRQLTRRAETAVAREIINQLESLRSQKDLPRVIATIGELCKPWLSPATG